ncbi:uncharacterized protein LOC129902784 [Solanum dulcamara]|uniref:uncharacterized protein LOC129902784 n=1 Tax=Solanum dulcamara TaxID=45834 RepID=UPI002486942A|nr:uncharacterized protein LOC129902784 [Solanum dulcamara]
MSWLARSIANTLRLDDDDDEEVEFKRNSQNDVVTRVANSSTASHVVDEDTSTYEEIDLDERSNNDNDHRSDDDDDDDLNRGVKEDLSELKETLTRQLWGVASFLAPPPPPLPPGKSDLFAVDGDRIEKSGLIDGSEEEEGEYVGDGSDYFENLDEVEESEIDAVGVTEEVLAFATNIAHHPETWLDFPLADEEEFDDFELSDAQQRHAYAVERLTPRLAALRFELCPAHLSGGFFWMVYFVLLYSRLKKHDAELLSTPQLVEARAMWMQELQKKSKPESDWFGIGAFQAKDSTYSPRGDFESNSSEDVHSRYVVVPKTFSFEPSTCHTTSDTETEKHSIENTEIKFIDKAVIEEDPSSIIIEKEVVTGPSFKPPMFDYDEHEDDWLKDNSELEGYTGSSIVNEEDVSFSDLEDDTDCTMPIKPKSVSIDYSTTLNVS